jgi:hypothetical protein
VMCFLWSPEKTLKESSTQVSAVHLFLAFISGVDHDLVDAKKARQEPETQAPREPSEEIHQKCASAVTPVRRRPRAQEFIDQSCSKE